MLVEMNFEEEADYPNVVVDNYLNPLPEPQKPSPTGGIAKMMNAHSKMSKLKQFRDKLSPGKKGDNNGGVETSSGSRSPGQGSGDHGEDTEAEEGIKDSPRTIGPDERLASRIKRARTLSLHATSPKIQRFMKKMDLFHDFTCYNYFTITQVIRIISAIPIQFPTARVALVQAVFGRLVDLENFWKIEDAMHDEYRIQNRMLDERLGRLNTCNPNYVDRPYMMYLAIEEDHKMANMLVRLAIDEPGENWCNQTYQRQLFLPPIPGWQVSESFIQDTPHEGLLCLEYYSGSDQGCAPAWDSRRDLMSSFLVGDQGRCHVHEFDHTDMKFMQLHKPRDVVIGGNDHDMVSALRTRNEKLLAARFKFEQQNTTWHLF
jgi:hypothetical protein